MENSLEKIHKKIDDLYQEIIGKENFSTIEVDLMKDFLRQAYEIYCKVKTNNTEIEPAPQPDIQQKVEDNVEVDIQVEEVSQEIVEQATPENPEPEIKEEVAVQKEETKKEEKSINEIIAENKMQSSIGERLQKKKIIDLTKAIGINEKFAFTRELFKGDSQAYNNAIKTYNDQENLEKALSILNEDLKKHNWDTESDEVLLLIDFIERRYL